MSNLISLLVLVSVVILPIVMALLSDLGHGLRLDRRLVITQILRLQWLMLSAIAAIILFFFGVALELADDAAYQAAVYAFATIYIMIVFGSIVSSISWLNSGNFSTRWHKHPYRERMRIQYLCRRNRRDGAELWEEFWLEQQTYQFFSSEYLRPYLKAFLNYLAEARSRDQEYVSVMVSSFRTALLQIYRLEDENRLGRELLMELLKHFETDCLQNQSQGIWQELISGYMDTMRLTSADMGDLLETDEYYYSEWQSAFGYCLAVSPVVHDHGAIKALAETIRQHFRSGKESVTEQKRYLASMRRQAPSGHKQLYRTISSVISDSASSNALASYLITQAERPKE